MREEVLINNGWFFTKEPTGGVPESYVGFERINLPHTWNAYDGQDGGADYFRGECWYCKELEFTGILSDREYYIEFGAVASECTVYINKHAVCKHCGGYGKFRTNITSYLKSGRNTVSVCVSNTHSDEIYPQMADFTFYGGIHRHVKLIEVERTHFDLDFFGADGVRVHSDADEDGTAVLYIRGYITSPEDGDMVRYILSDGDGGKVCEVYCDAKEAEAKISLDGVHLWQGVSDPYLYTLTAEITRNNDVIDRISVRHGFRSFYVDPQKGFYLNGVLTPLRGVSRHGDKKGLGLALSVTDHERDAELIRQVGANTVRLAHYQHDEVFYDLCDRYGFIVWAEIPFISKMNPNPLAHENCVSQMKELIYQNFNHSSICFWGISNEITIGGNTPGLIQNLHSLNDLVHSIDKTRVTTMAQVTMLSMDDEQNGITDILAYNHYFGWYIGKFSDNEAWLDAFHEKYPDRALGLSEYGCEGIIKYHSESPSMGDYSEEYQSLYHEHMLRVLEERPWIWGSYVWNMFDFGCDARDEGGVSGRNNKGLISFDRAIKKDAFYICKSYWSDEPFIHICSKRFCERDKEKIDVKVYSNCDRITLSVNGKIIDTVSGRHIFKFCDVELLPGENTIYARNGRIYDCTVIRRVKASPDYYTLKEGEGFVGNWFDGKEDDVPDKLIISDGYYSVRNTIREILESDEAGDILAHSLSSIGGMKIKKSILMMMADQTPDMIFGAIILRKKTDMEIDVALRIVNARLQKIKIKKR